MNGNNLVKILPLASLFLLASCMAIKENNSTSSPSEKTDDSSYSSQTSSESDKNYIENFEANKNINITEISDTGTYSTGKEHILVLPIVFTDKTFTSSELEEIKTLTGGKAEDTKYWESLGSFYEKSSYGNLELEFSYADPVSMGMTAKAYYNTYCRSESDETYGKGAAMALKKGVQAYKAANGADSTKKFDSDGDGYIDSVIMIYAETYTPTYDYDGGLYWAFMYYDYYSDAGKLTWEYPTASTSSPVGRTYFWASLDFFYDGTGSRASHTGIDAHTLIHEFGHVLGAPDYYNTDSSSSSSLPEATGGKIMMAYNVLDQDAFNKFQYNWVKPTYVFGEAEITLSSFTETGQFLLLTDENGWNETAFDEYVLVELFTPTGLNKLDSEEYYEGFAGEGSTTGYSSSGVRIWHVDNRLGKYSYSKQDFIEYYSDTDVKEGNVWDDNYGPYVAAANGESDDASICSGKGYEALSLISSKGKKFTKTNLSVDSDLFHAGDSFSLNESKYQKYFANSSHMNNGNQFPYKIEVSSLSDTSATIKITKVN